MDRRKFTSQVIKIFAAGVVVPLADILISCAYNKKEFPIPTNQIDKKLLLLRPKGGEEFDQVNSVDVIWTSENIGFINVLISYDGGVIYSYLKKGLDAKLSFASIELPEGDVFSENCMLRIESFDDEKVFDTTNQEFSITKGLLKKTITILYPTGNERLVEGSSCIIIWDALNVAFFDLQLFVDGLLWGTLASNLSDKFYNWNVNSIDSDNVKIKILDSTNSLISDSNSQAFRIVKKLEIDLSMHSELQNVGGSKVFESIEFNTFLVKKISASQFKVISMVCTHNACIIGVKPDQSFQCSCHGSSFDANGAVINGPANLPLPIFHTEYLPAEQKLLIFN